MKEQQSAPPLSRYRRHGNIVFISGQVPIRDGVVVEGSFAEQVRQTLRNVQAAVFDAGGTLDRVLKCNCYLRREQDVQEFNEIYREFFQGHDLPARTTLIASPPNPKMLVEVEAVLAA